MVIYLCILYTPLKTKLLENKLLVNVFFFIVNMKNNIIMKIINSYKINVRIKNNVYVLDIHSNTMYLTLKIIFSLILNSIIKIFHKSLKLCVNKIHG